MCLRFMFLLTTRLTSWPRLARHEETWKTAEILILRHQLAILQRRQPRRPRLDWADRALLATLFAVIPKARRHGLRLLVTPDTIVRWHRDIVRHRWAARSMRGRTGRPATRRNIQALVRRLARENSDGGTAGSTASWPASGLRSQPQPSGRSSRLATSTLAGGPGRRWHPDRALQRRNAPHERDHRTLDRRMPPRAPGPHPRLEPGPSATDPDRLRGPPQPAPAPPLPERRRAAETATRTG